MLESDQSVLCPYCGENITIRLDSSGGRHQNFVYDCEVCCRPIHLTAVVDENNDWLLTTDTE